MNACCDYLHPHEAIDGVIGGLAPNVQHYVRSVSHNDVP